jgi:RimJ/RimL family protein N-acetyltransferase
VTRYVTARPPPSREEVAAQHVPSFLGYYRRYPGYGFWAAIERSSGEFIGWFHLRPAPEGGRDDEPELGYRLRRSAWGKGYATEVSRALIDKAFRELGASRVFASAMAVNSASWRVMEKVGMRRVRTFHGEWPERIPGDEHGDVEYAITREEWERGPRPRHSSGRGTRRNTA